MLFAAAIALGVRALFPPFRITNVNRLNSLNKALYLYAQDHGGRLPPMESAAAVKKALFPRYVTGEEKFMEWEMVTPFWETNTPFQPNPSLSGKPVARWAGKKGPVTFYGKRRKDTVHGSPIRFVVFLHQGLGNPWITEAEWPSLKAASGIP